MRSYLYTMWIKSFKYLSPFIVLAGAFIAFQKTGLLTFMPVIYAFGVIPLLELFLKPDASNFSAAEEEIVKANKAYDFILYAIVPIQ